VKDRHIARASAVPAVVVVVAPVAVDVLVVEAVVPGIRVTGRRAEAVGIARRVIAGIRMATVTRVETGTIRGMGIPRGGIVIISRDRNYSAYNHIIVTTSLRRC
jgi:hypothetical protein